MQSDDNREHYAPALEQRSSYPVPLMARRITRVAALRWVSSAALAVAAGGAGYWTTEYLAPRPRAEWSLPPHAASVRLADRGVWLAQPTDPVRRLREDEPLQSSLHAPPALAAVSSRHASAPRPGAARIAHEHSRTEPHTPQPHDELGDDAYARNEPSLTRASDPVPVTSAFDVPQLAEADHPAVAAAPARELPIARPALHAPPPAAAERIQPHLVQPARSPGANLSALHVRGPLAVSVVRRAIERIRPGLAECYAQSRAGAQSVELELFIDENGRVRRPVVRGASQAAFSGCLASVATKLVTSAPDTGTASASLTVDFE